MRGFMNLNDPSHDAIVNVPGLPMKYSRKRKLAMAIWAIIFSIPFMAVLILAEIMSAK